MLRTLIWHWRSNLAVAAAAAVATAVLSGALVVGDSLRDSLRRLSLERLGGVDVALAGEHPFTTELADRMTAAGEASGSPAPLAPALALRGTAIRPASGARATRVGVWGVDERFFDLLGGVDATSAWGEAAGLFPPAAINEALRSELGAAIGDDLLLAVEGLRLVPRESLLGEREGAVDSVRVTLTAVLPDRGPGGFAVRPDQRVPRNVFVPLAELGRRLRQPGLANALFAAGPRGDPTDPAAALDRRLRQAVRLEDLGVRLRTPTAGVIVVESREIVLPPAIAAAVFRLADERELPALPVLTYVANELRNGQRTVPYSTIAALDLPAAETFGALEGVTQPSVPAPREGEILLDAWTADELAAAEGDEIEIVYWVIDGADRLVSQSQRLRVAGLVAMRGLAVDGSLTPELPGITDSADLGDWNPPFPVDLSRIRPVDEAYWDLYRAAPKAFVSLSTGQKLWRNRFGELTSIRLATPQDETASLIDELSRALPATLAPASLGLSFRPVKQEALAAASGATDFSGLFLGFSLFLILASALLVSLLFRLAIEARGAEIGLRRAVGFPLSRVRRRLLAEGLLVAVAGGLAGTLLAVLYGRALVGSLHRLWAPLLGAPFLELAVQPGTLAAGFAAATAVVWLTIALTLRRMVRLPPTQLLAGDTETQRTGSARRSIARGILATALAVAAALGLRMATVGWEASPALFFALGATLSAAGFAAFSIWCSGGGPVLAGGPSALLTRMAARNSRRNPSRSLLGVVLVGSACFVLVSVTANRRDFATEAPRRDSGTGGFLVVAETEVPLPEPMDPAPPYRGPATPAQSDDPLEALAVYSFRLLPGEDTSCLNLYRPTRPRVVGVPESFLQRGGFAFHAAAESVANPWSLLQDELEPGVIPAIGDYNSVRWILQLALGEELTLVDDLGDPVRLRLVGTLDKSIFQSELLISEEAFLRHFPRHGGYRFFVAEGAADAAATSAALEDSYADLGLDAVGAAQRLAAYQGVEEVYLATFQVLGGLGLLLGTLGLAIVEARSVIERRGELATLRAFGYRRSTLAWMVVLENGLLLAAGMLVGSAAGLIAVAPQLLAASARVPWSSLATTLAVILLSGLLASIVAVRAALRTPLLPVLKEE